MEYRTKQIGWIMVLIGPVILIALLIIVNQIEDAKEAAMIPLLATTAMIIIVQLLFFSLETRVNNDTIQLSFGIGLIKKEISIENIESIEKVRNKFIYGWGIRRIPGAWMWNIAGYEAVELSLKDKNQKFRIGCKNSEELLSEIKKRM
ncbi:hypothetical protein K6119_03575 [Paracrocinitomix mangrovi]|uniref:hypothetical protein n=1 Tax=Paracrocinitomix mangrovi TaxID=2862509 RepID=UPI001C8DFABF|nr:hypothetical protein [Paracrocinitomix mangrovi]UKN02591.1 hypothetical protein K6119_03575 [Paracrocinitomix mangrovi]